MVVSIGEGQDLTDKLRMIEALRLYYIEGKNQSKVGELMHISQAQANRLLAKAKDEGLYQIVLSPLAEIEELQAGLLKEFPHLQEVYIEPVIPRQNDGGQSVARVGLRGAQYFVDEQAHRCLIGLSCGQHLLAMVEGLRRLREQGVSLPVHCSIYTMVVLLMSNVFSITPAAIGSTLINNLPQVDDGVALQFPTIDGRSRIMRSDYEEHADVIRLFERLEQCDYYFIGIGHVETGPEIHRNNRRNDSSPGPVFNDLVRQEGLNQLILDLGAAAECVHQLLDDFGDPILNDETLEQLQPLSKWALFMPLHILKERVKNKNAKVVAIASGEHKHKAVLAALRSGIFNVLICDPLVAKYALDGGNVPRPGTLS